MKIQAMVASGEMDSVGDIFSENALKCLKDTGADAPITLNGQEVGKTTRCWMHEGKVFAEGVLGVDEDALSAIEKLEDADKICLVPGITFQGEDFHLEGNVRVWDRVNVLAYILTARPEDTTLMPIEVIGQDEEQTISQSQDRETDR